MRTSKEPQHDETTDQRHDNVLMMQKMMGQSQSDDFGEDDEMMQLVQGQDPDKEAKSNRMQSMMQNMMKTMSNNTPTKQ